MGGIIWWAWGFAFAFGNLKDNLFIGNKYYFGIGISDDSLSAKWWISYAFATASTSIVSGCLAERINIYCYICFSILTFGFIYPMIVAWTWGGGWLH